MAGQPAGARRGEAGERVGGSNSVVESQPSKLLVAGSIPVSRSSLRSRPQARELRLGTRRRTPPATVARRQLPASWGRGL